MIHCTPVEERWTSSWIVGIAIATIVWSMKVIATAKIIAARISLLLLLPVSLIASPVAVRIGRFLPGINKHLPDGTRGGSRAPVEPPPCGRVRRHATGLLDRRRL